MNEPSEVDSDEAQQEYEVTIRAWGPDHEPGEADYHDVLVEAVDKDEAEDLAWDEIDLDHQETGETVQVEPLPDADGQLVTDGGKSATALERGKKCNACLTHDRQRGWRYCAGCEKVLAQ